MQDSASKRIEALTKINISTLRGDLQFTSEDAIADIRSKLAPNEQKNIANLLKGEIIEKVGLELSKITAEFDLTADQAQVIADDLVDGVADSDVTKQFLKATGNEDASRFTSQTFGGGAPADPAGGAAAGTPTRGAPASGATENKNPLNLNLPSR